MTSTAVYYALLTIAVCTGAASQVLIKSRLTVHGEMPAMARSGISYILRLLGDPLVLLSVCMLIAAALTWYFVVSRIPLSIAFAFAALSYPMVLFGAHLMLKEPISLLQIIGNALIVAGIVLVAFSGRPT